ncbi:MAG: patatin-like phospholipase family protein [Gemmatimonadales bacterium]|nr:patatin-like phospholipase family protein [Gemmatimonadales bacterium]
MARDLAVTLAGGGNRALLQVGLLRRWWPRLEPRVAAVSTCSAGASMAVSLLGGRELVTTAYWFGRRAGVTRNVRWSRLLRGERPTPHTPIYRDTLRYALAGGGFERLRALPFPLFVLAAAPPAWLPVPLATALGLGVYSAERQMQKGRLHPSASRRLGFRPVIHDLRACAHPEEIVDLVLASSATPPFTPVGRRNGAALLDGGLVDNAPAFVAEQVPGIRRHLVLLTRPYPEASVGRRGIRWYVAPGEPVPISRWEYTRPDLVEATIALGDREAVRREAEFKEFLDGV